MTLSPFSSQIYQFGITDEEAPQVVSARIIDEDTIEVRFDERVNAQIEAEVNGSAAEAQLSEDYRTVKIAAEGVGETAPLKMSGIRDIYGNAAEEYNADVRTSAEIASARHAEDVSGAIEVQDAEGNTYLNLRGNAYALREDGISGTTDFSVSLTLNTIDTDTVLLKQGEDYTIGIDAGRICEGQRRRRHPEQPGERHDRDRKGERYVWHIGLSGNEDEDRYHR